MWRSVCDSIAGDYTCRLIAKTKYSGFLEKSSPLRDGTATTTAHVVAGADANLIACAIAAALPIYTHTHTIQCLIDSSVCVCVVESYHPTKDTLAIRNIHMYYIVEENLTFS